MKSNKSLSLNSGLWITTIVLIVFFFVSGCHSLTTYNDLDEMVSDIKKDVKTIGMDDFKQHKDEGHNNLIIDCREIPAYIEGHIPGAINVPRGNLEFSSKVTIRRDNVYIYCDNEAAAILAARTLRKLKFRHVWVVEDGWEGWKNKYPDEVETGAGDTGADEVVVEESGGGCGG